MKPNIILQKSEAFAVKIVKLNKRLVREQKEYTLSNQLLRSGTSIAANSQEGSRAYSHSEFNCKMSIALKEAAESAMWLRLLHEGEYIDDSEFRTLHSECNELIYILSAITKTAKEKRDK